MPMAHHSRPTYADRIGVSLTRGSPGRKCPAVLRRCGTCIIAPGGDACLYGFTRLSWVCWGRLPATLNFQLPIRPRIRAADHIRNRARIHRGSIRQANTHQDNTHQDNTHRVSIRRASGCPCRDSPARNPKTKIRMRQPPAATTCGSRSARWMDRFANSVKRIFISKRRATVC